MVEHDYNRVVNAIYIMKEHYGTEASKLHPDKKIENIIHYCIIDMEAARGTNSCKKTKLFLSLT